MKAAFITYRNLLVILSLISAISCESPDEDETVESGLASVHSRFYFDYSINDFSMANDTCGWAVGDDDWAIMKYSAKGSWELVHSETNKGWQFSSVFAVSPSVVYLGTQKGTFTDPFSINHEQVYSGSIFKTTNGGTTWQRVYSGMSIGRMFFVNENVGFAITRDADTPLITPLLVMTKDGGDTWKSVEVYSNAYTLMDVAFVSEQKGFIVGTENNKGFAYVTSNGGLDWTNIELPRYDVHGLTEIEIVNENVIYLIGGLMYRTEDGGTTWEERCFFNDNRNYHSSLFARYLSENEGFSFGSGTLNGIPAKIAYTNDGGTSWIGVNDNTETELENASIVNAFFESSGQYVHALYRRRKNTTSTTESILCMLYLEGN